MEGAVANISVETFMRGLSHKYKLVAKEKTRMLGGEMSRRHSDNKMATSSMLSTV
jgi:hypothetical protein